jgi:hypothetical protein
MMSNMFIKPASIEIEGVPTLALVRDPDTRAPLATEGEWKPRSQFWNRRLRDGDVIPAEPTAVAASPAAADAPAFATCETCAVPDACAAAGRCVKAPV